jgi:hypothetical protein
MLLQIDIQEWQYLLFAAGVGRYHDEARKVARAAKTAGGLTMRGNLLGKAGYFFAFISALVAYNKQIDAAAQTCLGNPQDRPEISAFYIDNFNGWHSVGGGAWLSFAGPSQLIFNVCSVDNNRNFLIAENNAGNDSNPSKFSRFEWHGVGRQLFYCQQVFDANTAAEAADFTRTPMADTSDPNDRGCGVNGRFPWSQLSLIAR